MKLIDQLRAAIKAELDQRDAVQADLDSIVSGAEARGDGALTDDETKNLNEKRAEIRKLDEALAAKRASLTEMEEDEKRKAAAAEHRLILPVGDGVIRREELTYNPGSQRAHGRSFFADAYRAQFLFDSEARQHIERHQAEMRVELRDVTSSTFNGLIPPKYLLDLAAPLARAMRPFANAMPGYPLPDDGMTLTLTKVTTGTAVAAQSSENTAATETNMVTTDFTVPVVTILGQQDLSRQSLERGALIDQLVFTDLMNAHASKLDGYLFNGAGSSGEPKGALTLSGTNSVTLASTAATTFLLKLADAIQQVNANRYAPATVIVMHPRRWGWITSATDTGGRPLLAVQQGGQNVFGDGEAAAYGIVGAIYGVPVISDGNVPLVTASTIDNVIVTRLPDQVLAEGPVRSFTFDQAVNPPATVRLAVASYCAATFERYATATSVITGTGLIAPTF